MCEPRSYQDFTIEDLHRTVTKKAKLHKTYCYLIGNTKKHTFVNLCTGVLIGIHKVNGYSFENIAKLGRNLSYLNSNKAFCKVYVQICSTCLLKVCVEK